MSKRWDYQVIEIKPDIFGSIKPDKMQAELKRLGAQGWELVSTHQGSAVTAAIAVFKREL